MQPAHLAGAMGRAADPKPLPRPASTPQAQNDEYFAASSNALESAVSGSLTHEPSPAYSGGTYDLAALAMGTGSDAPEEIPARSHLLSEGFGAMEALPTAPLAGDGVQGRAKASSSPAARRPPSLEMFNTAAPPQPGPPRPGGTRPPAPASGHAEPQRRESAAMPPRAGGTARGESAAHAGGDSTVYEGPSPLTPRRLAKELPKSAEAMRRSLQTPTASEPQPSAQQQLDAELWTALHVVANYVKRRVPALPKKIWRALPGRRFTTNLALFAVMIAVAAYSPLSEYMKSGMHTVARNVKDRAAFQFADDFTTGIGSHWDAAGMISDSGAARVNGFTLNRDTMGLSGYRMDFDVKIASRGLGWVVGAIDENNYYAFKLEDVSTKKDKTKKYRLARYAVSQGAPVEEQRVNIEVAVPIQQDEFNRISVRLRENSVATFINGSGVDYWQTEQAPRGGVGFFTEKNESAWVQHVEVSGNEDTWGLFLFGFLELIEDAKGLVEPVTASSDSKPPAAAESAKTSPL